MKNITRTDEIWGSVTNAAPRCCNHPDCVRPLSLLFAFLFCRSSSPTRRTNKSSASTQPRPAAAPCLGPSPSPPPTATAQVAHSRTCPHQLDSPLLYASTVVMFKIILLAHPDWNRMSPLQPEQSQTTWNPKEIFPFAFIYFIYLTFILPGRSTKCQFLFTMTACK